MRLEHKNIVFKTPQGVKFRSNLTFGVFYLGSLNTFHKPYEVLRPCLSGPFCVFLTQFSSRLKEQLPNVKPNSASVGYLSAYSLVLVLNLLPVEALSDHLTTSDLMTFVLIY